MPSAHRCSAQDTHRRHGRRTQAEAGATETESDQASDPAAEPATDATPKVQTGRAAQEDPTYIKEEYGDWQLKCFRSEAEEDPCQMYQLLTEEAGNPVAEFSLFRLPEGAQAAAGATIVVPLGTLSARRAEDLGRWRHGPRPIPIPSAPWSAALPGSA